MEEMKVKKYIRGIAYSADFVNWMTTIFGSEELMPSDRDILLMNISYIAGMNYGYDRGCKDTEKLAENNLII